MKVAAAGVGHVEFFLVRAVRIREKGQPLAVWSPSDGLALNLAVGGGNTLRSCAGRFQILNVDGRSLPRSGFNRCRFDPRDAISVGRNRHLVEVAGGMNRGLSGSY